MKENSTVIREAVYIAPLCITTDIESEGVLCSSIAPFDEELDYDPWTSNQN